MLQDWTLIPPRSKVGSLCLLTALTPTLMPGLSNRNEKYYMAM